MGNLIGQLPVESLAPKALFNQGLPLILSAHEAYSLWTRRLCRIIRHKPQICESDLVESTSEIPKRVVIETTIQATERVEYEDINANELWRSYFEGFEARILRQKVFESLWSRGFYVQTSTHLFTDFVVYEADPLLIHAAFIVVCLRWNQKFRLLDLMSYGRLASTVKKSILLATERPTRVMGAESSTIGESIADQLSSLSLTSTPPETHYESESASNYGSLDNGKEIALVEFRWSGVS